MIFVRRYSYIRRTSEFSILRIDCIPIEDFSVQFYASARRNFGGEVTRAYKAAQLKAVIPKIRDMFIDLDVDGSCGPEWFSATWRTSLGHTLYM